MDSIQVRFALIGENLEIKKNIELEFDDQHKVKSINKHDIKSNFLAIPGFYNAHIHAADIGIRGEVGDDLHAVVGPGGVKQRYLDGLSQTKLRDNIKQAIAEGRSNGVLGFVDFREDGVSSYEIYNDMPESYIPHIRPTVDEFDHLPDGVSVGVRDVVAYSEENMEALRRIISKRNGRIEIHASEDQILRDKWLQEHQVSDIIWSIEKLQPNAIVHATHADKIDIKYLRNTDTGVIICPVSNQYFGVGIPPIQEFLDAGLTVAIGSDNAMVNKISLWKDISFLKSIGIDPSKIIKMATIAGAKLSGIDWGITQGNSNILVFEIPESLGQDELFKHLCDPSIIENLRYIITPEFVKSIGN